MLDIRDLVSGSLHIERIVFSYDKNHVRYQPTYQREKRTHYYVGAASNNRFLLIEIPSPEAANEPIDLLILEHPTAVSRSSDTDFHYSGGILFTPQPRSASNANFERAFRAWLRPLQDCLQLGITEAKPGSIRWDGDHFTAEYPDEMKNYKYGFSMKLREGIPDSAKEKHLADLLNPPENETKKPVCRTVYVEKFSKKGKVIWSSDGNLESCEIPEPVPGSVEAQIVAHQRAKVAAKHEAQMAKGISGQLVRDAQGNVSEIRLDLGRQFPSRIELEYAPNSDLPLPFPHRIKKFMGMTQSEPEAPVSQMTIYSVRTSEQPLDDASFVPWKYLKEGSYVQGKAMPDGRFTVADPKDSRLCNKLVREQMEKIKLNRPGG